MVWINWQKANDELIVHELVNVRHSNIQWYYAIEKIAAEMGLNTPPRTR